VLVTFKDASSAASANIDGKDEAANDIESIAPKLNRRLKRMKSGFIPAPRVANENIKYIR
jgi:hypothetical protein